MIEYEVTHEVDLWLSNTAASSARRRARASRRLTVFARYSGNQRGKGRPRFCRRADGAGMPGAGALRDVSVSETITRKNVFRADTERSLRKIACKGICSRARHGAALRRAAERERPERRRAEDLPLLHARDGALGYRGKLQEWVSRASAPTSVSPSEPNANESGGHVDYVGGANGLALCTTSIRTASRACTLAAMS
jgi:hypothetical protein